jgi:predicted permease
LPPHPESRTRLRALLALMMGASAIVLLIACANVASLLSIKGIGRRHDVAVRKALGASRLRLVRQHVTEGTLLWLLGGVASLLVVWLLTRIGEAPQLAGLRAASGPVPVDWRVITFAAGLSLVVGITFSVRPAFAAARAEPADALRDTAQTATVRTVMAGTVLSAVQLAASLALLVAALLLAGSIRHLSNVPLGFNPAGVTTFQVDPTRLGYTQAAAFGYARAFEQRLAAIPGVHSVAVAEATPFSGNSYTRVRRVGADADAVRRTLFNVIGSPSYFATLGIELRRGRLFNETDVALPGGGSRPVVILSENLARQMFGSRDAVGQLVEFPVRGREGQTYEVIGVVANSRFSELVGDVETVLYEPAGIGGSFTSGRFSMLIRTFTGVHLAPEIHASANALDPALPVGPIMPLGDLVDRELSEWTLLASLMTALAVVATVLAAVGLYGVVAFSVGQRLREFGIRLALGATPATIVRLVLRRQIGVTLAGLGVGLGGAAAIARALESRLVGVDRFEPGLWAAACGGLIVVIALASLVPARRAARADATQTLRAL